MNKLTKREQIKQVPNRWYNQYAFMRNSHSNNREIYDKNKLDIYNKLLDLDLDIATDLDISNIIGNSSWTELRCECCNKGVEEVVFVETSHTNEYGNSAFCNKCLNKAVSLFTEDKNA